MADALNSANLLLTWHEWVRVISFCVLGLGILYAVYEYFMASRSESRRRRSRRNSLRMRIAVGLTVVGVVPAVSLGLFLAERSAHLRQERLMDRLEESAIASARAVNQFIDKHRSGVLTAASAASTSGEFDRESLTKNIHMER